MTDLTVISLLSCAIVLAYIASLVLDKIARQDDEIEALCEFATASTVDVQRLEHGIEELNGRLAKLEADLEEALTEYEHEDGVTIQ